MTQQVRQWTNSSVLSLAQSDDPLKAIQEKTQRIVLDAAEAGWQGPPFDPFHLADLLKIRVSPNNDVLDARTLPASPEGFRIEFNPHRPHARTRYSVAHEIVHTLFPDCAERVRHRSQASWLRGDDDWQLELLCNVGAAELLMPSAYANLESASIDINNLLKLRTEFAVSTEALFRRVVKATTRHCAMFAAARPTETSHPVTYRIDYSVPSRNWQWEIPPVLQLGSPTVLAECTAVGYTARGTEHWGDTLPELKVECVGVPPYPGSTFPRIVGILTCEGAPSTTALQMGFLFGDAMEPRGGGSRLIAHIVNDKTSTWGGGFALGVRKKWPFVQHDFRDWVKSDERNLSLGNVHLSRIEDDLAIVHMIAQHGYGPSNKPRIKYAALKESLDRLADIALNLNASVHMPRIGSGQAGGNWLLIRELVDERLVRRDVPVFVYSLPDALPAELQGALPL